MSVASTYTWLEYLRGQEKDNQECSSIFKDYQKCLNVSLLLELLFRSLISQVALNKRGIDKLLEDAREDNRENDVRLMVPKSKRDASREDMSTDA